MNKINTTFDYLLMCVIFSIETLNAVNINHVRKIELRQFVGLCTLDLMLYATHSRLFLFSVFFFALFPARILIENKHSS